MLIESSLRLCLHILNLSRIYAFLLVYTICYMRCHFVLTYQTSSKSILIRPASCELKTFTEIQNNVGFVLSHYNERRK